MISDIDTITIEPAQHAHIGALARVMRAADVAEVQAAGLTPYAALRRSYRGSTLAKTAFVGGEIAAMWGLDGSPLQKVGRPWILTAPPVERVKVSFLRIARVEVAMMLAVCPELRGYVDAQYHGALRLLSAVGFDLGEEFPFGPNGMPFRQYAMRRYG